jgi:hypothetical protein
MMAPPNKHRKKFLRIINSPTTMIMSGTTRQKVWRFVCTLTHTNLRGKCSNHPNHTGLKKISLLSDYPYVKKY